MTLLGLFTSTRRICPFCLAHLKLDRGAKSCGDCARELPPLYLDSRPLAPSAIQVFGWSGHGKTAYLSALTMVLMRMSLVWRASYSYLPINDVSQRRVQDIDHYVSTGEMPRPTQRGADECYVMLLSGMEPWGGRSLMIRDSAGEVFESMTVPIAEAPFLIRATTTFMFVSLSDLKPGRAMNDLLAFYLGALAHHGVSFKKQRRRLVVVLTKADLLPRLPPQVIDYLRNDPLWQRVNMEPDQPAAESAPSGTPSRFDWPTYLSGMRQIDHGLRTWLQQRAEGQVFVQLATSRNIELRFTAISSIGAGTRDGGLWTRWEPHRVLDPYFWALELEGR